MEKILEQYKQFQEDIKTYENMPDTLKNLAHIGLELVTEAFTLGLKPVLVGEKGRIRKKANNLRDYTETELLKKGFTLEESVSDKKTRCLTRDNSEIVLMDEKCNIAYLDMPFSDVSDKKHLKRSFTDCYNDTGGVAYGVVTFPMFGAGMLGLFYATTTLLQTPAAQSNHAIRFAISLSTLPYFLGVAFGSAKIGGKFEKFWKEKIAQRDWSTYEDKATQGIEALEKMLA